MPSPRRVVPLLILLLSLAPGIRSESIMDPFYPCRESSENEFALIEFLITDFTGMGLDFSVITYDDREDLHSFSRSIRVDFNRDREDRMYFAVSLNGETPYSAANTEILYNVAHEFSRINPDRGITLLFLGGEKNKVPVGTTAFLEEFTAEETSSLIYLELNSPRIRLISSTRDQNCAFWLLRDLSAALKQGGVGFLLDGMKNLLNRSGFGESESAITPWLNRDIPSLLLTGSEETPLEEEIPLGKIVSALIYLAGHNTQLTGDYGEKNYLILSGGDRFLLIDEWHSILAIITGLSLFTILIVFQSRKFILNFRKNRSSIWVLGLIFSLIFTLLYLSSLISEEIMLQKDMADLWSRIPRDILFFKLLLTLLFSSFFLFIIRGIPIPRAPHFYSYGAILFAIADLLLLASRDISLTYYALWLLGCLFPFALTRKLYIKSLLTILTPLPIIYFLIRVVLQGYPYLSRYILMDRIEGNLLITAFLMPYILMLTSLHYSRFYYHRDRRSFTALAVFILDPLAVLFILARIVLFTPFSDTNKQPVQIRDDLNYTRSVRTIQLESPQPMGTVNLEYNGVDLTLNNLGESVSINGRMDDSFLSYQGEISSFLNRKRLLLTLDPKGRPDRLEIRLSTQEGQITVYDCNFPYANRSDNRESRIIIGNRPPFPLNLDLTVTLDTKPVMEMTFFYSDPPLDAPLISNKPAEITYTMTLTAALDLSPDKESYFFPGE
ncbi:MAG: hypothetical protein JXA95_11995 [Spirochaetales bacterium]|nr:hypothetical protein [Spirochaetales bacterium]